MFEIPSRNPYEARVGYRGTSTYVEQTQLMRIFQNTFHGSVIDGRVALGIDGDAQLLQVRESRRAGLILQRCGRQADQTVG